MWPADQAITIGSAIDADSAAGDAPGQRGGELSAGKIYDPDIVDQLPQAGPPAQMFGVPQPECRPCLQLVMWLNAYALSTKLISQVSAGGLQYGLCWFHRVARQEPALFGWQVEVCGADG